MMMHISTKALLTTPETAPARIGIFTHWRLQEVVI